MNIARSIPCLALMALLAACTNAHMDIPAKQDASPDLATPSPDVAPDTVSPSPDLRPPMDLGPDAPADLGKDTTPASPDISIENEAGSTEAGPGDGPGKDGNPACYYQLSGGRYSLKHFTFLLTTPDGQAQTPPNGRPMVDASFWPTHDFEGLVVGNDGNQLTVDSCDPTLPCQSALYRFTLCDGFTCAAASSPAPVEAPIPIGRRVRVVWHLDNYTFFCSGLYWLVIYDAEVGPTQGNILFLGSGGHEPSTATSSTNYFNTLPFSVSARPLLCGGPKPDGSWLVGDDYAFVFSSNTALGSTLELQTGQSDYFIFAPPSAKPQRLLIRCLDAVQPDHTDDYWNWDFWATGDALPTPGALDGGTASPLDASGGG